MKTYVRKFIIFLFAILLLSKDHTSVKCFDWDVLGLKKTIEKIKELIKEVGDEVFQEGGELLQEAKKAFMETMESLFNDKILPMIYQIQAMISKNLNQIIQMIQDTIDHFINSFKLMLKEAAELAKGLFDKTYEEIKEKIVKTIETRVEYLGKELYSMIEDILNFIDEEIYMASCSLEAIASRILNKILQAVPWYNPWDSCRVSVDKMFPGHNIRWKLFSSFMPNELYEYRKCYIFKGITEQTPVTNILLAYREQQFLAGDMRCIAVAYRATENQEYYIDEMAECVKNIEVYQHEVVDKLFNRMPIKFLP
jgi:hypothetical protein